MGKSIPELRDGLPARTIPLLYFGAAHVSLALASLLVALSPQAFAGFFYHSRMVALVHLVTLGWITFSILGAIYLVGPIALRMTMPAKWPDYAAWLVACTGVAGMIAHFWLQEFGGMAWSALTVTAGVLYVAARIAARMRVAGVPAAVKLHIVFACVNIGIAASMGILIAFDKTYHFLPGFVLSNVFAHAHMAALGWAAMMVVGVGYRLLPMVLPSRMPSGPSLFVSAVVLEVGVLGLFVTLLLRSALSVVFGGLVIAGLASFLGHVGWMANSPARKPAGAPRVDFAVLHAAGAGISLLIAIVMGVTLLVAPTSPRTLRIAAAYGVFGLVGFLAQMVVAMETRLIPLFSWYRAYAATAFQIPPPSPLAMRDRTLQAIVFAGWTVGVPALAAGFGLESARWLAVGGWALFAGVIVGALDHAFVLFTSKDTRS